MSPSPSCLLLRGGRLVDPASGTDARLDVEVRGDRISAIGADLPVAAGTEVIDCRDRLVLPGLIDTHAHVYRGVTGRFGLDADLCGVRSGVPTLVDQGGPSCITLPGFREFIATPARSRVLAFLSAYLVGGLEGHYYPSLYRPDCLDMDATVRAALAHPDLVRGIKAHAEIGGFARWGVEVISTAARIGQAAGLPVYVHFGQLWPAPQQGARTVDPDQIFSQVLELLRPGDILAHPFSRHPGGFVNQDGRLHPLVRLAVRRGLRIDVGHGSHFSFRAAQVVLEAGIVPDTLGADMHGYNTAVAAPAGTPDTHPDEEDHLFKGRVRFGLVSAMTSMLALGLSLQHVVGMATHRAARMIGMSDTLGQLAVGRVADISVLQDHGGRFLLRDNEGTTLHAERWLAPDFCLRAGIRYAADSPLLPEPLAA